MSSFLCMLGGATLSAFYGKGGEEREGDSSKQTWHSGQQLVLPLMRSNAAGSVSSSHVLTFPLSLSLFLSPLRNSFCFATCLLCLVCVAHHPLLPILFSFLRLLPPDSEVLIHGGMLLQGIVDKNIVGTSGGSIVHVTWLEKGSYMPQSQ